MRDIESRSDIVFLLEEFYGKVFHDGLIGHYFTEVVPLDLKVHIPVIADFWESVLFQTGGYRKNVIDIHRQIHHLARIEKPHFDRWLQLFSETVEQNFVGERSVLIKQRARSIATLMDLKLNHPGIGNAG